MSYEPTVVYDKDGYASVTARGSLQGVTVVWVDNARNAGGTYADDGINYPWRIVLHEVQGWVGASYIRGHAYPPHIWYDPRDRTLYQTVPLGRSAFALYQARDAPYRTNKARALQVELGGYSEFVANEPQVWLDNITEDVAIPLASWVSNQGGAIDLANLPKPWQIAGSAYPNAPQRFHPDKWASFNGLCTHANVPMGDDHWDTGALDIWRICEHARLLIAGLLNPETPVEDDDEMFRCLAAPDGTLYIVRGGKKITVNQLCKDFNQPDKDVFLNELFNAGMLKDKFWTNIGWYGLAVIPWSDDAVR